MIKRPLLLLTSLTLVACSTTKDGNDADIVDMLKEQTGQDGRACVRIFDIDSYGFDGRVITIDGGRQYYVGTTLLRCHEADMAFRMKFNGPGGDFCGSPNSTIVSSDGTCTMKSLFEFESREEAFAALNEAKTQLKNAEQNEK